MGSHDDKAREHASQDQLRRLTEAEGRFRRASRVSRVLVKQLKRSQEVDYRKLNKQVTI